jgi:hypothetical protein
MAQPLAFVRKLIRQNFYAARKLYPGLSKQQLSTLRDLTTTFHLSVAGRDVLCIDGNWYVSHPGLLRIANRRRCFGIKTEVVQEMTEVSEHRWVFKATVRKSQSKSFVGYGDADPSNVSAVVRGAEMRVAETRAVNRALRKAYGIGICSVEELGSFGKAADFGPDVKKIPAQPANGHCWSNGPRVRDRLVQLIRHHQLDPELVKSYATEFCGTKTLKEATRAQVENFVEHLADWAEKDRNALLCQLNSYLPSKENHGAA